MEQNRVRNPFSRPISLRMGLKSRKMLVHVGHFASLSSGLTTQPDHCNAGSTMCLLHSLLALFNKYLDGRIFSYSIATKLLTGVARLFFEASGNLQAPLTGRTISKKREVATHNALVSII